MLRQLPISLHGGRKTDVRTQFAALCYRVKAGKLQILLITSRGTKRWIVPKGWPMDGRTPGQSAALEAWEEAGVRGDVREACLGVYSYAKETDEEGEWPCLAMLYPLRVRVLSRVYPEQNERRRRWMSPKKAASKVAEPELARLIRDFDPARL